MALPLFLLLEVPYYLNSPPLYSIPSHYWRFHLVLSSRLKALTALNPFPANRLVISIFTIDCTKFSGLYCHPAKENH